MGNGQVDIGKRTFQASAAMGPYLRVKLSAGKLALAGAGEADIGTLDGRVLAVNDYATVRLWTHPGTRFMVAAGAITQYAAVYGAAAGQVDDTVNGHVLGYALEAAAAPGDIIEVLPILRQEEVTSQVELVINPIMVRTWDALATNLPAAAANDDLALITGTPGTDGPTIQAGDVGGTTSTRKAGFMFVLPPNYRSGEDVTIRLRGGMLTTVADTSCAVDLNVYECDEAGAAGADVCATAAQSINSLDFADKDFTITPTNLAPGDLLSVVVSVAYVDAGDAGVMIPEISKISVLLDAYVMGA